MLRPDELRESFKGFNLTYADVRRRDVRVLMLIIEQKLEEYNAEQSKSDAPIPITLRWDIDERYDENGGVEYAFIRCDGNYFDDREAISFNSDGFIGFCCWADSKREDVFMSAFVDWLYYMSVGGIYIRRKVQGGL